MTLSVAQALVALLIMAVLTGPAWAATASWYGESFHGRTTANGETYNQWAYSPYTAAHKTLPFGTLVLVRRGERQVTVCINDRGPFIEGRDIDLNRAAAEALNMIGVGVAEVSLSVVGQRENCR